MSVKQSSSNTQEFVSCASNICRHDTVVDIEFKDVQFSPVTLDTNDKVLGLQESESHSQEYFTKAPTTRNKPNIQQISISSLTNGGMYNFACKVRD